MNLQLRSGAIERAILDCLADVMRLDCAAAVEVRDRARDFQNSRVRARAQPEPVNRKFEQALARRFNLAVSAQIARAHLRVTEKRHPGKTIELNLARLVD